MVTSPCWQEAVDWAVTPSNSSAWNKAGTLWGATGSYNLNLTLFRALSWELPQQAPRGGVRQPSWREAENLPAYRYVTPHHHTAQGKTDAHTTHEGLQEWEAGCTQVELTGATVLGNMASTSCGGVNVIIPY